MNPYDERTLVVTVRVPDPSQPPEVWLTLYDGHEVREAQLLSIRGPVDYDDMPFGTPDGLETLLAYESARHPRLL